MYYLPAESISEDLTSWNQKLFGPGQEQTVNLNQPGLYRVACFLRNGESSPAQVSNREVDLRAYAQLQITFPLDLTFHENRQGRAVQVMSARLIDPQNMDDYELTVAGNDAESNLVDEVLRANWTTTFQAVRGPDVSGELDLDREASRGGPVFAADRGMDRRLSQLLAYEDAAGCHVLGRWVRQDNNIRGTFHFLVSRNQPNVLRGTYKVDGERRKYSWTGNRSDD
jgi:hypothetical protein